MMKTIVEPCPHCGGTIKVINPTTAIYWYIAVCMKCEQMFRLDKERFELIDHD